MRNWFEKAEAKRNKQRRKCANCEAKVKQPTGRGRSRRYCSSNCRQQAYEKRRIACLSNPLTMIARDIAQARADARIRRVVLEVLGYSSAQKKNAVVLKLAKRKSEKHSDSPR